MIILGEEVESLGYHSVTTEVTHLLSFYRYSLYSVLNKYLLGDL